MAGLIDLTQYKTIAEKQLVDNHNLLVDALNSNFSFTLDQVTSPVPATSLGHTNDALVIGAGGSLTYKAVEDVISVDTVFSTYLSAPRTLRLNNSLSLSLLSLSQAMSTYGIFAGLPGGSLGDGVTFTQTSTSGDMQETHNVSQFVVNADTATINSGTGSLQVNGLTINTYSFPTTVPAYKQVLRANSSGNLEFQTLQENLAFTGTYYSFPVSAPVVFTEVKYPNLNVSFGTSLRSGFGFDNITLGGASRLYFRIISRDVMYLEKPANVLGSSVAPYVAMKSGLVLAPTSLIDPISNPEGSIWYDSTSSSIVLLTGTGRRYINSSAVASSVNTEESKDFVLNASSTLSVAAGNESKPSLNIGNAGLSSSNGDLKFTVSGSTVARISTEGIEAASSGSTATAKVLLSDSVGINNPAKPAYSFTGADGLGIFRSNVDAVAVAVKGSTVVEFSDSKVNVKGNKVSNVATPVEPTDAANKGYVDSIVPLGFTPGCLPVVSTGTTSRYVQSDAKYANGQLELGSTAAPGAFRLNSSGGGAAVIKAPATNNNVIFELPSNSLDNGVLQLVNGRTVWVNPTAFTSGAIKADGTVPLSAGLSASVDTSPQAPLVGKGNTGLYAMTQSSIKVGISAQGSRMVEVNAAAGALLGATDSFNAPYIRLKNTISTTSSGAAQGLPTYSFAGETSTGIGQAKVQSVSMMVNGSPRLSAGYNYISAHNNQIQALADPSFDTDAATKGYVDRVAKPRKELAFRVTSLPVGWSSGSALILSIYDKALIYQSSTASLVFESASDPLVTLVPTDFSTNADCQVYVNNNRLVKMATSSGIRQAMFGTSRSLVLNYSLTIGDIVTIHLPG